MLMEKDGKTNYAGRCAGCGAMRAVTVADDVRRRPLRLKELAETVSEFIISGLVIDRVNDETVRSEFGTECTCPKPPEQGALFDDD